MHKSHLAAEWVLARMSSKERASEIVGDLIEQEKSPAAFWFAVARIAFAMSWRWMLAIPAAMLSFVLELKPYSYFVVFPYMRQVEQNLSRGGMSHTYGPQPMPLPMMVGQYIAIPGICLWTVAALAICLFGLRSTVTRISGLLAILFTATSCTLWLPYAYILAPAGLVLVVSLLIAHRPFRRPLPCIVAAILSVSVSGAFLVSFITSYHASTQTTVLIGVTMLVGYITCIVAEAWTLTRTRRWLLPSA